MEIHIIRSSAEDLLDEIFFFSFCQMVKRRVPTSYDTVSDVSKATGKFSSFKCGEKFRNSYELELFLSLTVLGLQNDSKELYGFLYLKIIGLSLF